MTTNSPDVPPPAPNPRVTHGALAAPSAEDEQRWRDHLGTPTPALPDDELATWVRGVKNNLAYGATDADRERVDQAAARLATLSTLLSERDAEIERLREAGNALAKVGDDKLAFRSEWLQALTAWRALSRKDS